MDQCDLCLQIAEAASDCFPAGRTQDDAVAQVDRTLSIGKAEWLLQKQDCPMCDRWRGCVLSIVRRIYSRPEVDETLKLIFSKKEGVKIVFGRNHPATFTPNPSSDLRLRWARSNVVDIEIIQSWPKACDSTHTAGCAEWPTMPFKTTVTMIDVENECLTKVDGQIVYLALSYVWGKLPNILVATLDNVEALSTPGALGDISVASRIPRTIQDAMRLTAQFKVRYLWVDSLCIVKDDLEHKQEQLAQMAAIYTNAYFTIIAADGKDANHGLRGSHANTIPRQDLTALHFPHGVRLYLKQLPAYEESMAPWYTRAWTYQERALSHRVLVFVRDTVFWQCRTGREDELRMNQIPDNERKTFLSPALNDTKYPDLKAYYEMVSSYNTRHLSYESDAYDAFSAVLDVLSQAFDGGFHFGIPEVAFDIGLLWTAEGSCQRRSGFPSWSWVGMAGNVGLNRLMSMAWPGIRPTSFHGGSRTSRPPVITPLNYYFKLRVDGTKILIANAFSNDEASPRQDADWQYDPSLGWLHLEVPDVVFDHPFPRPEARTFADMRGWTTNLIFRAASCTLTCRPWSSEDTDPDHRGGNKSAMRIDDKSGAWIGILFPDDENPIGSCTLISMSKLETGTCAYFLNEIHGGHMTSDYTCYNVLWIEWEGVVAYRRGIGRVEAEAWERQQHQEIDIVLG